MNFALFEAVRKFNYLSGDSKIDDDFVDRINRYWTAMMLVMAAIVLSARQIVGEPLKCWTPAEFSESWNQFTEDYCWVKNTYFVSKENDLPNIDARKNSELKYYQWIPYMLALQAFMYYLPAMVWRMLNWKAGLDLTSIVQRAGDESKHEGLAYLLATNFKLRADSERKDFLIQRNFLSFLYLFMKLLYSLNSVGQFLLLSSFFGRSLNSLFVVTRDLAQGSEWYVSGHFPRITFCDFSLKRLGNIHNYTVQCVLTINIFTEKIFIVLGYWMLLVAVMTLINSFSWFIALLLPWRRHGFISSLLPNLDRDSREYLLDDFLRSDGLLLMHLIATNNDEVVARHLLQRVIREEERRREARQGSGPYADDEGPYIPMKELGEEDAGRDATLQLKSRSDHV